MSQPKLSEKQQPSKYLSLANLYRIREAGYKSTNRLGETTHYDPTLTEELISDKEQRGGVSPTSPRGKSPPAVVSKIGVTNMSREFRTDIRQIDPRKVPDVAGIVAKYKRRGKSE